MEKYNQLVDNLLWFHIANEQAQYGNFDRHKIKGRLLKLAGKLAGVLDYIFIWRDDTGLRIFFLEAKAPGKGGVGLKMYDALSETQQNFVPLLDLLGIPWKVFDSPNEGLKFLQEQGVIKNSVIF